MGVKISRRLLPKVREIEDLRSQGEGVWFHLEPGWVTQDGTHSIHEDTIEECLSKLRFEVLVCFCEECLVLRRR